MNLAYEEGSHLPVASGYLYDHSPPMVQRGRAHLRATCGTVERLRAAHHDPGLTYDTAVVPRDPLRAPETALFGLEPVAE